MQPLPSDLQLKVEPQSLNFLIQTSQEFRDPIARIVEILNTAQQKPNLDLVQSDLKLALLHAETLLKKCDELLPKTKIPASVSVHWSPVPVEKSIPNDRKIILRQKMWSAWQKETPAKLAALRVAMRDHQWSMVAFWAQNLKGASAYLQLPEIHRTCCDIEVLAEAAKAGMHSDKIPISEKLSELESAMQKTFAGGETEADRS